MKKIPIGHLVSLKTVGGVERFFTNFSTLTQERFEHHVFLSNDEIHPYFRPLLSAANVKTYSLRKLHSIYVPKFPPVLRQMFHRSLIRNTGIKNLVLWNKLEKFPIHFPDNLPLIHFERGSAWLASDSPQIAPHLNRCQAILANSQAGLHLLRGRWGFDQNKPHAVAHNGVNPQFTLGERPVKTLGKQIRLGFAGRFVALKGWVQALQALRELDRRSPGKYQLVIGGAGEQRKLFDRLVGEWNLGHLIVDLGLVKDMKDYFQQVDIFLHTSLREPFGNVAVEAQARGCPVIGGIVDGNPEIIRDGKSGLLLPMQADVQELASIDPSLTELPPFVWDPVEKMLRKPRLMKVSDIADAVERMTLDSATFTQFSADAVDWIWSTYNFEKRSRFLEEKLTEFTT